MAKIVFVDKDDNVIGAGTKKEALEKGIVHRISRIFLFNSSGEMLIHKRSENVPVPGKWDQSVGGHVDEGENYLQAAYRELQEELSIKNISLQEVSKFYTEETDGGDIKKRFNTLYSVEYEGRVEPNKTEVAEIKWVKVEELEDWMEKRPEDFTQGFIKSLNIYQQKLRENGSN